ncbi:hypothetical protein [Erythrobacter sp. SD-21]|uniref:hypothetical protein n=1 Tax=Erythrobacter sp. SD-21 TaxID=161528 RepID=UPI000153F766|nr:hypothetical protein [Erythrobacter sp. SD-21]EDL49630.1 hypothetical protein ED21_18567 [Erythrobacter sp. SD-21]
MSDSFDNTGLMGRTWFKPAIGAWFALLLGGGLWLMPPHVHALIAQSTGLAGLDPMFAPPVSPAGVAVICGVVALFGLFLGIAVAARVAAATAPRAFAPGFEVHDESAWSDEPDVEDLEQPRRRRVFSAREDIGEEGIAISAPPREARDSDEEGDGYEQEFTVEYEPVATPEEDFDAVYAGMNGDYVPAEDMPEEGAPVSQTIETAVEDDSEDEAETGYEFAEFEELPEEAAEYVSVADPGETKPDATQAPLDDEVVAEAEVAPAMGDMSLEALLGRLEGALDAHKAMVAESEEAARRPAPQPIPMTRETAPEGEWDGDEPGGDDNLPEASDDDPVIAFLRREASRRMPQPPGAAIAAADDDEEVSDEEAENEGPASSQTDAQAALRSALDRLGQVNRRD